MLSAPLSLTVPSHAFAPPLPAKKPHVETLFENAVVKVSLTTDKRLSIETLDGCFAIDDESVAGVMNATKKLLDEGDSFSTMWDLRNCPVPSPSCVLNCLQFAIANKSRLDASNKKMAIVLPATRPIILVVVKNVLSAFAPTCPVCATTDSRDAAAFLEREE